jgi:hypothetical protein
MQDGCKVYMDPYVAIEWIMFHGHLDYIPKTLLEGRPNTKLGDHDIIFTTVDLFFFIMSEDPHE